MENQCRTVGILTGGKWDKSFEHNRRVYDVNHIAPTLVTHGGGNHDVKIGIEEPVNCSSRGRNPDNPSDRTAGIVLQQRLELGGEVSNALTTVQKDNYVAIPQEELPFRVRKLTPLETWRLMGFSDDDFERASQKVSNSQLYKQAGNSIVVNVLEAIFRQMLPINYREESKNASVCDVQTKT